jgi:nickel-dependent lactate racemase
MGIKLKYGEGTIEVQIPDSVDVTILEPKKREPVLSIRDALNTALVKAGENRQVFLPVLKKNQKVAIAIPDETRPLPIAEILPHLLEWLYAEISDLRPEGVTIVIGCGLHPTVDAHKATERLIPPNIAHGCRVIVHDAFTSPTVNFGFTSKGTPIHVNEGFATADHKIVVGLIDPHQIVGFTDGISGLIIGCSGEATIEHNHSLMFHDAATAGVLDGNPVREDLNEAGELIDIDLAVDFVLAPNKEVVEVLAGLPLDNLSRGAQTAAALYGVAIDEKFDIVVASCGGYPKDICLYQAQKGLHLASQAVKNGGHILLLAALSQGVGDDIYFDYVSQFTTPEEVLVDFRKQEFRMGAHKAFLFGRTLSEFDVAVHSELDQGILKKCHLRAANPSQVIAEWLENSPGNNKKIGVITNANTTYFYNIHGGLEISSVLKQVKK